jgi:hypothetical protein
MQSSASSAQHAAAAARADPQVSAGDLAATRRVEFGALGQRL